MPLFKKKKRELPVEDFTLPEPPGIQEMPAYEFDDELPELPELPSPNDFEHEDSEMIKREFGNVPERERKEKFPGRIEMGDEEFAPESQKFPLIPSVISPRISKRVYPIEKPIFVKIDKFRDSIEHLNEVRNKLRNASSLLQRLKEIRQREDQEVAAWERDLNDLKARLEDIDKKLFSDVE